MIGKGKLGVTYKFYAVLALVLAIFGQTFLTGVLLGFVLLVEKDEWTSRQCMQALFLTLFVDAVNWIISLGTGVINLVYDYIPWLNWTAGLIVIIITIVFALIGISNVLKGKDAGIPQLSNWAYKAFGYLPQFATPVAPAQAPGQPYYGQPQPPMGQAPMAAPPMAPQSPPMAAPVAPQAQQTPPMPPAPPTV